MLLSCVQFLFLEMILVTNNCSVVVCLFYLKVFIEGKLTVVCMRYIPGVVL